MQIGNRQQLDAERWALIAQLDAVWMAVISKEFETRKERRCRYLAIVLAHCDTHGAYGGWILGQCWRVTSPAVMRAEG